ncbi:DUF6069 family protein [Thermobifida cellulosilytica]|uniref:Uncharacterized protein n=1 Tax=Thermobifida cellulosilytica TB100 TaxID=665004 RepID=A0A147KGB7_THECS|nr:DUF6069 family protein [Thermobifida cellulosilytica]KUP96341.1 hypothetical protein AC529_12490 [Thermobifida cellulosilytica TB100]
MTEYGFGAGGERPVNAVRLWAGGLATAVVAALVVLAGTLLVNGLLGASAPSPEDSWQFGGAGTAAYAVLAALGALAATGLLHLLLPHTPRPLSFFCWIVGLAVVVATVSPFTQGVPAAAAVATALLNLAAGAVILSLLSKVGAAARAERRTLPPQPARPRGN